MVESGVVAVVVVAAVGIAGSFRLLINMEKGALGRGAPFFVLKTSTVPTPVRVTKQGVSIRITVNIPSLFC